MSETHNYILTLPPASHVVVTSIIVWQLSKAENTFQSTNTLLAELRRMSWQIALPPAVSSIIAIAMLFTQVRPSYTAIMRGH